MKLFHFSILGIAVSLALTLNCEAQVFTIKNHLKMPRTDEIISISVGNVRPAIAQDMIGSISIKENGQNEYLISQLVDNDLDGKIDEILFRASFGPREKKTFMFETGAAGQAEEQQSNLTTFSRFYPERQNDYAWENDRVGFRVYGSTTGTNARPTGGGVDAFMKRVSYPVLEKWYKNNAEKEGAYHIDTGEGYDPYQVGASRGIGGIGIWDKDSLYVSASFLSSKRIAAGPLRTIFELTYAPWNANGRTVNEVKRVSLDLGSHLNRVTEIIKSDNTVTNVVVGITLHDKKGLVNVNEKEGWYRYWEPMDDSWLGTAILADPASITSYQDYRSNSRDQSHLLVFTKPAEKGTTFYTGYAWAKSGHFATAEAWDKYLSDFSKRLSSPLVVRFK